MWVSARRLVHEPNVPPGQAEAEDEAVNRDRRTAADGTTQPVAAQAPPPAPHQHPGPGRHTSAWHTTPGESYQRGEWDEARPCRELPLMSQTAFHSVGAVYSTSDAAHGWSEPQDRDDERREHRARHRRTPITIAAIPSPPSVPPPPPPDSPPFEGGPPGSSPPSSVSEPSNAGDEEEDEDEEDGGVATERRICGSVDVPFVVDFADVNYSVPIPATHWYRFNSRKRQVLFDVSGQAVPGELLALMGPSGSGKTTLLNVIGDRVRNKKDISGAVLFNGKPMSRYVRRYIAFVLQDDLLFPHLTARETLRYAALLKLPSRLTRREKIATAENVLRLLRLQKCADTKIGGPFQRGLSGGERKRVSIGVEMLNNPSIIMMDEPTSGLDSFVAMQLIRLLKEVARKERRTIIVSIHQPSSQIFYAFDKLLLLVDGRVTFRGPIKDVVPTLEAEGVPPPTNYNPADFVMALMAEQPAVADKLTHCMAIRRQRLVEQNTLPPLVPRPEDGPHALDFEQLPIYETTLFHQIAILLQRQFKQQFYAILAPLNAIQGIVISVLAGLLWFQLPYLESRMPDRFGLVFFIVVVWSFTAFIISINIFPQERAVLWKERKAKYYRLSAYMLAKWITEATLILIPPLFGVTITYFIAHLQYTFLAWFETMLIVILNVWVLQAFALFVAVVVPNYQQAVVLGTTLLLGFMLLGGFYIRVLPNWLVWTKYMSVIYYAVSLAEAVQFVGVTFFCDSNPSQFQPCIDGAESFDGQLQLELTGLRNMWGLNFSVLLGTLLAMRLLSYLALKPQV